MDSNHRTLARTDLQSVAFSHSATYPYLIFSFACLGLLNLPLTRLELVTSPLPRECSTSEPQGLEFFFTESHWQAPFGLTFFLQSPFYFSKTCIRSFFSKKAGNGTRTYNLRFTKPLLCQLSYTGKCLCELLYAKKILLSSSLF